MSLIQDYDDAIEATVSQLKRTLNVLLVLAFIGLITGGFLSGSISIAVLLVGWFGAHHRHTGLLMGYAATKISFLVIGFTAVLLILIALTFSVEDQLITLPSSDLIVISTVVACTTLLYTLYLAFVFRSIGLSLRLRAFIRERRFLEDEEDVEDVPTKDVAAPMPMMPMPVPMPMPMMPYPQPFMMPQPVMQPGAPMPVSFYPPMYMPVPQAAAPQE